MKAEQLNIEWRPGEAVSAVVAGRLDSDSPALLLAHGAGSNQDSPATVEIRDRLVGAGYPVMTFNYPYAEAGRRAPDRPAKLLECHRAVLDRLTAEAGDDVVLAGRSMGGRMGSMLAADGAPCRGLVYFGYPLHPPGRYDKLRIEHLPRIAAPMLFLAGTRDSLSRLDILRTVVGTLPTATLEVVEGADHSFRVPKRSGLTHNEVLDDVVGRAAAWLGGLRGRRSPGSRRG